MSAPDPRLDDCIADPIQGQSYLDAEAAFAAHQAESLSAAGFGLVADAKAEALEEAAAIFAGRLPNGTGNGRAYNSYQVADMLRARAAAIRATS